MELEELIERLQIVEVLDGTPEAVETAIRLMLEYIDDPGVRTSVKNIVAAAE